MPSPAAAAADDDPRQAGYDGAGGFAWDTRLVEEQELAIKAAMDPWMHEHRQALARLVGQLDHLLQPGALALPRPGAAGKLIRHDARDPQCSVSPRSAGEHIGGSLERWRHGRAKAPGGRTAGAVGAAAGPGALTPLVEQVADQGSAEVGPQPEPNEAGLGLEEPEPPESSRASPSRTAEDSFSPRSDNEFNEPKGSAVVNRATTTRMRDVEFGASVVKRAVQLKAELRKGESSLWSSRNSILRGSSGVSLATDAGSKRGLPVWRQKLRAVVSHFAFESFCGCIILLNTAIVGIDVELNAQRGTESTVLTEMMLAINIWFVVEVLCRILAEGRNFFTDRKTASWNWFDFLMALTSVLDVALPSNSKAQLLRLIRVVRVMRSLRLVRWLRQLREFRKMIFSLLISLQTLLWAIVLLVFVMYVFGIWFTSLSAGYIRENRGSPLNADLAYHFGSLPNSMYSLWVSISGGFNWHYIVTPLYKVNWWWSALFITYIAVTLLGVMNIIVSVFVESAMSSTQHYRDLLMQERARYKETLAKHLRDIFKAIDVDNSGMINMKELRLFLDDKTLELQSYLEALEISAEDAKALFKLLDADGSGQIDIQEFIEGCMRLKGEAKSFDINVLLYNSKRVDRQLTQVLNGLDVLVSLFVDEDGLEHLSTRLNSQDLQGVLQQLDLTPAGSESRSEDGR